MSDVGCGSTIVNSVPVVVIWAPFGTVDIIDVVIGV